MRYVAIAHDTVLAADALTGETLWTADPGLTWIPGQPACGHELVFVCDADRSRDVVALDGEGGSVRWRADLGEPVGAIGVVDDRLLVQAEGDTLFSLATP